MHKIGKLGLQVFAELDGLQIRHYFIEVMGE